MKSLKVRHPIRRQFFLLFTALVAAVIILSLLANSLLLERFYIRNKERTMAHAITSLRKTAASDDAAVDALRERLQDIAEESGIMTIVLDSDARIVASSAVNTEFLARRLWEKVLDSSVLLSDAKAPYSIDIGTDEMTNADYMEGYGYLDTEHLFLMRSAITSIRESVAISNRFTAYIGIFAAVIALLAAYLITGKATKPITELTTISAKMKDLDFDAKYTAHTGNELDVLGQNINELSDALEDTISRLKSANNELKKDIAKKEEIDAQRREFLSNVSHELKTPIALIRGYAEGLKEGVYDDEESKNTCCGVIVDESERMNRLVQQLIKLNQLEFGNEAPKMERFDIVALIQNYLRSADILLKQANATLRTDMRGPVYVWGDEFFAEEVLQNYLSNATQHLGGERIIEVKVEDMRKYARISVFNTGSPIPEESIGHIWEKFYKADKARTRGYGGSGIGLSIVKAIQDQLHAGYGVVNYNNGVAFWFELDKLKQ